MHQTPRAMSEARNPHDDPEAVRARSEQEDPWVMYLVVRRERLPSLAELLAASATAAVRCVDQWRDHPTWREGFDAWLARSFRKVCLRASEKDWAKLQGYDQGLGHARGGPVLCALPPRTKSQRDKLLVNLQAFTTGDFADAPGDETTDAAMRLVRNEARPRGAPTGAVARDARARAARRRREARRGARRRRGRARRHSTARSMWSLSTSASPTRTT